MTDLIPINYNNPERPTVSGRELHEFLRVKTAYKDWFPRMIEYGFIEGEDFNSLKIERVQNEGGRMVTRTVDDHQLTIQMAKEIAMIQRNERGKIARQYFIKIEEQWNSPDAIMQRALLIANTRVKALQETVTIQTKQIAEMKPKEEYFDDLIDVNSLMNFTDTAKALKISRKKMLDVLVKEKYLYRQGSYGKLIPYEKNNHGYFEVKEQKNAFGSWAGPQTFVTVAGRQLLLRMRDEGYFD